MQEPEVPPAAEVGEVPDEDEGYQGDAGDGADAPDKTKKKKKSKSRSKKNKKPNPTGFEEFYADPPITPNEHEEESDLYAEDRPFADRIQTCIQRYRARRKLDEVRGNIFTKYLMLGGIESTNKAFTGGMLDKETVENSNAREIAAIQASDFVRLGSKKYYDPTQADNWVVDWEGVAKGFFSYRVPEQLDAETESDIKLYSSVIRNFLNYVLQHVVCLEYTDDIMAARMICSVAEKELWAIKQIRTKLPGDFNVAASTIYGGYYHGHQSCAQSWQKDNTLPDEFGPAVWGFDPTEASRIFQAGVAFAGTDRLFIDAMGAGVRVVNTLSRFYQVVEIQRPDLNAMGEWAQVKDSEGKQGTIKPLGIAKCTTWAGPGLEDEDKSDDGFSPEIELPIDSFWLEDDILQLMFVGMKLNLLVHELNIGFKFFDRVLGLYCSFYNVQENEKMTGWKDPVPNTRPAPTDDDPDAEERALQKMMEGDVEDVEKGFGDGE